MSAGPGSDPGDTTGGAARSGVPARQLALAIVMQVHEEQAWASPVADRLLGRSGLDDQDRAFAANLAFQTLRWEGTLDWILQQMVTRDLADVELALLDVLRIGTWELLHGSQPGHAVVDSHVEVARAVVGQRATGFVNGVLRGASRRLGGLEWPDPATPLGLALQHGYPEWIAVAALDRFGPDRAPAVLAAGNSPAPVVLRAVAPREEVLQRLAADGIDAHPGLLARDAVVLDVRVQPRTLAVIAEGMAIVQDQASQVVGQVAAADLPAGARAIDLCAAPGGKATHLAQQGLDVLAVDRHPGRLRRTAEAAERLGLTIATLTADGTDPGLPAGEADLVLVDAPCSGLGVVRRRPELRWRRGPEDVDALAIVQARLLRSALALVRGGGRVVYSVCTWTAQETDGVVDEVVADDGATVRPAAIAATATRFGAQMSPDVEQCDGMYVAVLERTEQRRDG